MEIETALDFRTMKRTNRPESELTRTRLARSRIWVEQTPIVNFGKQKVNSIMLLKPKIRGVSLHALAQSGFYPQINLLDMAWSTANHRGSQIEYARPNYWLKAFAWFFLIFSLYTLFIYTETMLVGGLISVIGLIAFAVDILMQPWSFACAVNRLDEILVRENTDGIAAIPKTNQLGLLAFMREKMEKGAYRVLHHEEKYGRNSGGAKGWLEFMEDLGSIALKFGDDLGKWDPYFEKAAKRLAEEKEPPTEPAPTGA